MSRTIGAHEIGEFAFCSRAWWLVYVRGAPQTHGFAARRQGAAAHGRHALGLAVSRLAWRLGLAFFALAAAAAAFEWLVHR